ncbi:hypothetical protein [Microcella sp.]|uniref:hypothetical protein n=1 Tax=Microcella sp. TaxID=1913979 RepID=UPI00391DDCCB
MALTRATVGGKAFAFIINAIIDLLESRPPGMVPIIPGSVAGTGVSVDATGLVTVAAATTISLNDIFTTDYSRYEVHFDFPTSSADITINARLRAAGTDDSSAVYDTQSNVSRGADTNAVAVSNLAQGSWAISSTTGTRLHFGEIELARPDSATPTLMKTESFSTRNPATAANTTALTLRGGLHRSSTAYDGLSLLISGGTATGAVRVYGIA